MARIILLVSEGDDDLDRSDQVLFSALRQAGGEPVVSTWESFAASRQAAGTIVFFRSIVSAHSKLDRFHTFLRELRETSIVVANGAVVVDWNLDKRYLVDLDRAGIACPKSCIGTLDRDTLLRAQDAIRRSELVIKPRVGGSGQGVHLLTGPDPWVAAERLTEEAERYAEGLIVQEFCPGIKDGEFSIIWIAGQTTHLVLKKPHEGEFRVNGQFNPFPAELVTPLGFESQYVARFRSVVPTDALIMRIDYLLEAGAPVCMEVELIDPNLYLDLCPAAATILAQALLRMAVHHRPT